MKSSIVKKPKSVVELKISLTAKEMAGFFLSLTATLSEQLSSPTFFKRLTSVSNDDLSL